MNDRALDVGDAFRRANAENDGDALRAICAPEMSMWHNFDRKDAPIDAMVASLAWMHRAVRDLQWVTKSLIATSEGFVWRNVVTGIGAGGPLAIESCIVVTVNADGMMTRLEEYLDPAEAAALRG